MDHSPRSILKTFHPLRLLIVKYNNRVVRKYLYPHIQRVISEPDSDGPKTITNLAAKAYLKAVNSSESIGNVDPAFIDMAIAQMKMFIFAGHDTTAAALCYTYHLLSSYPSTLAALRAEHDSVFGPDACEAAEKIRQSPHLLNQLPYTSAVIKETLRLFPPVGTVRQGHRDFFLTHPETRQRYPTDGFMLFGCSMAAHRNAKYFQDPDAFVPERWLGSKGMPKSAYRPFELGPRNCIGQELAQMELRAILALTVREFDVVSAYDPKGGKVLGDLGYQVMKPGDVTGKPVGGMPVRVKIRT
jgi:cytochrome P450